MAGTHVHSGGCTHHSAAGMSETKLKLSLVLTLSFVVIEALVGQSGATFGCRAQFYGCACAWSVLVCDLDCW